MSRVAHPRGRALGALLALAACTAVNPAYEGSGGRESEDPLASSGRDDPASDGPGPTSGGTSSATATTGTTMGEPNATDDTGPEVPPEPIEVGPFGPAQLVEGLNDPEAEDDDPTLPADMLEIYFNSARDSGNNDIWRSSRPSVASAWAPPQRVASLSSDWSDDTPEVSADGLVMLLVSNRETRSHEEVFMSTRPDRDAEWGLPTRVEGLSTGARDVSPFPTTDGRHVYSCVSVGMGILELDLVRFDREAGGAWSGPVPLVELNTDALDCGAWVDESQQVIVFTSTRLGGPATDLWQARRSAPDGPFEAAQPIAELNTGAYDEDPWLSPSGDTVFFASDRDSTDKDLWVAQRVPG